MAFMAVFLSKIAFFLRFCCKIWNKPVEMCVKMCVKLMIIFSPDYVEFGNLEVLKISTDMAVCVNCYIIFGMSQPFLDHFSFDSSL